MRTYPTFGTFRFLATLGLAIGILGTVLPKPPAVNAQEKTNPPTAKQSNVQPSVASLQNEKTYKILDSTTSVNYEQVPFAEVMDELKDEYDLNMILTRTAIDDSLSEDETITFQCKDLRLKKILKLMLKEKNATYTIEEGVVMVISMDVASDPEFFERRIIDVRSLLARINIAENKRITAANQTHSIQLTVSPRKNSGIQANVAPGLPRSANQNQKTIKEIVSADGTNKQIIINGPISVTKKDPPTAEKLLLDLVKRTVDPSGWDSTNGDGTIEILGGLIVLINTSDSNDQIEDLLNDLEYRMSK